MSQEAIHVKQSDLFWSLGLILHHQLPVSPYPWFTITYCTEYRLINNTHHHGQELYIEESTIESVSSNC
jgi:hypothetical protein